MKIEGQRAGYWTINIQLANGRYGKNTKTSIPTAHQMNSSPIRSINIFKTETNQVPVPRPFAILEKELKEISVERVTLVSRIVEYLFEKEPDSMTGTIEYLKEQLGIR